MHKKYLLLLLIFINMLVACSDANIATNLGVATSCDAAVMACVVNHKQYSLTLQLGPDVKPLSPFTTQLELKGANGNEQGVVVDFRMVGMDMGLNRYRLIQADGIWKGKTTLPVCTASRTDWIAIVEFADDGKKYTASFPFQTDAN